MRRVEPTYSVRAVIWLLIGASIATYIHVLLFLPFFIAFNAWHFYDWAGRPWWPSC